MAMISFDFPFLDKRDRQILFELDRDSRQSSSKIAEKLKVNKNVVNYRINKLIDENTIQGFYTVINSARLGYQSYRFYLKWQFISEKKEKEIREFIVKSPVTWWVGSSDGEFDFIFLIWVKNILELREFWKNFTNKYQKYIQKRNVSIYTKIHDLSYAFFSPEKVLERSVQEVGPGEIVSLTKTEEKVLPIIAENARMPTIEVAKKTNLTPMQVKYALKQLEEKKVILGYRTRINIQKLGLTLYKANFQLKDLEKYEEMVEFAKTHPNAIYVDESIAYADFELEVLTQKHWEFLEIMAEFKEKFSEKIKDYNYFIIKEIIKINYSPLQQKSI